MERRKNLSLLHRRNNQEVLLRDIQNLHYEMHMRIHESGRESPNPLLRSSANLMRKLPVLMVRTGKLVRAKHPGFPMSSAS
jgi:hypothetical protein